MPTPIQIFVLSGCSFDSSTPLAAFVDRADAEALLRILHEHRAVRPELLLPNTPADNRRYMKAVKRWAVTGPFGPSSAPIDYYPGYKINAIPSVPAGLGPVSIGPVILEAKET